jgi:Putative  PD-(D/E)XK family member, (DUF4420)
MTLSNKNVWIKLAEDAVPAAGIVARPFAEELGRRLNAGIDSSGHRHLLIKLCEGEGDFNNQQMRGIHVTTRELTLLDKVKSTYLDILCRDTAGHSAFDLIAQEIASQLKEGEETAPTIVINTLLKWRRFWSAIPQNSLSREEQIGLFGELWFLIKWLFPRAGKEVTLKAWRGPAGARHDFEFKGHSIEVKCTTSTIGPIHHVHGLEQLSPPETGDLQLFSLMVREEGGASNSLPHLVDVIRKSLIGDTGLQVDFENRLAQASYSDAHRDEYELIKLRVRTENLYKVDNDFPCLSKDSFGGEVPAGIETVQYVINLSGFSHLVSASKPEELLLDCADD